MSKIKQHGFTVVEIIVVVAIIGIIGGLVINVFGEFQRKARNTETISAAKTWYKAMQAYLATDEAVNLAAWEYVCLGEGYPDVDGNGIGDCRHVVNGPFKHEESVAFNADLSKHITGDIPLPSLIPINKGANTDVGAFIGNNPVLRVEGELQPYHMLFTLEGADEDCKVPGIIAVDPSWPNMTEFNARNSGYWTSTNATNCIITIPNPS